MFSKLHNRVQAYKKRRERSLQVNNLLKIDYNDACVIKSVWSFKTHSSFHENIKKIYEFCDIFGEQISLERVDWHKDYVSGFEYPNDRFDKIQISQWFNKGIDIKFPWEVSRFYFAVPLAQNYRVTGETRYYERFKELITDWIYQNPFLCGVNWHCTMEVALRAVNWTVAVNFFGEILQKDEQFRLTITKSLLQHAYYIEAFPEIKYNGKGNNHLVADYFGLLILALTLKDHHKAAEWLQISTDGLVECMQYQVNDDGSSFEGSIPYHRLVLEMFGYTALVCRTNNIDLPPAYYEKLFKMFEFTAAYMDHNGNAPQIGDNDSGRTIILHYSDEHDHSYLLDLGEHLFDFRFLSQCSKRNNDYVCWLPMVEKITVCK